MKQSRFLREIAAVNRRAAARFEDMAAQIEFSGDEGEVSPRVVAYLDQMEANVRQMQDGVERIITR